MPAQLKLTLEPTTVFGQGVSGTLISRLMRALEVMHQELPIDNFSLDFIPGPPPGEYHYDVTLLDGRVWSQVLKKDGTLVTMNHATGSYFSLEELVSRKIPLDLIVEAILLGVTKLTIDF